MNTPTLHPSPGVPYSTQLRRDGRRSTVWAGIATGLVLALFETSTSVGNALAVLVACAVILLILGARDSFRRARYCQGLGL